MSEYNWKKDMEVMKSKLNLPCDLWPDDCNNIGCDYAVNDNKACNRITDYISKLEKVAEVAQETVDDLRERAGIIPNELEKVLKSLTFLKKVLK